MKKKTYITPAAKEVNLLTMEMLATSTCIEIKNDRKGDEQLSNEWRDGWGDMWS
jgi:hypothetical protein